MGKVLLILVGFLCVAGGIFGIVMAVMAVRFMEYGRVIFYLTLAILCIELAVVLFMKGKNCRLKT